MYNNNTYGYNPYGYYPQTQPMQNSATNNQMTPTLMSVPSRQTLSGKVVDGIDTVKGIDIPLDGSVSYFPLASGDAIITKQLQPDGTSKITVFKPISDEKSEIKYITADDMKKALSELDLSELDDIKDELKELKQEFKDFKKNKKRDD